MHVYRPILFVCCVAAALLAAARNLSAEPAPAELLKLVGDDAVVCIEAIDLRRHWPRLLDSPFARRLEQTWFYREWRQSGHFQKLQQARAVVEKQTGRPLAEFAADLFGQSVVVALYARDDGGDPDGVVLTRASAANVLQDSLAAWNREPTVTQVGLEHAGVTYSRRTKPGKHDRQPETLYHVVLDDVLALSDHESLIQRVIDLHVADGRGSLSASDRFQRARRSLGPETVVSLYFNPRVLDGEVNEKAASAPEARLLADAWRQLDGFAAGLSWNGGISGECVVQVADDEAAAAWRSSVQRLSGRPKFLERVPRRALAVYAGRHDLVGLARLIIQLTPEDKREKWTTFRQVSRGLLLGMDLFDDVLPQLGANWGAYIVPSGRLEPNVFPAEVLAAVELPPPDPLQNPSQPTLRAALANGLNTGFNLIAAFHNAKHKDAAAVVRSKQLAEERTQPETVVRWIDGLGPYRPAYALVGDAVVFASSPELVEEYIRNDATDRLVDRPKFQRWRAESFADAHQVAFVHLAEVRTFLAENRRFFVAEANRTEGLSDAEAEARLNRLNDVLRLFDGAYVAAAIGESELRLRAGGIAESNVFDGGNGSR